MKRSLSARVRKISDVVLDVVVSTTTNRPRRTRDDSAFDYGGRGRQPHKGGESNLKRSLSHRNICKDDIRPYSRVNPSKSTLDLWVGGGTMKGDVERPRPHVETSLRSRFSADTEDLVVQTPRGRKAEKKTLVEAAKTQRPERPPRPVSEDLLKDLYGERNAVGFAPPAACAVSEQLKEEERRQKMTIAAAGTATARPGEDVRHRGSTTQVREASAPRLRGAVHHDTDNAVGPPVPPKDYTPPKMKSPFAPLPSQRRLHVAPGAALTRGLSTSSAPDGTAGISKLGPVTARPTTLDERRQPLNMDEVHFATTGMPMEAPPRPTDTLHRASSWGSANTRASGRPPLYASARPLHGRDLRTARPDENEPRLGHAEYRPYKPSPLRTRQPFVAPAPPSSRSDAHLAKPHHKRNPSEMDLPRDVFPEDGGQVRTVRRPPGQPSMTMNPHATMSHMGHKHKPLPASPALSTRTMARAQGPVRVKEVPRSIQMTMTIATPSSKRPVSYDLENDVVVIAPLSPTLSMASTRASLRDFHDEELIERLMTRTDDPRIPRQDMFTREQLQFALADEAVRPLSIYQKPTGSQWAR